MSNYYQVVELDIQNSVDALVPHGAGPVTADSLRHHLDKLAKYAFTLGRSSVLMSLLTVEDVATHYGITSRRVRAIARVRHDRFGIGWQVPGTNQWLFQPEELAQLQPDEKYRRKQ